MSDLNTWVHIAATWNGTDMFVYKNGQEQFLNLTIPYAGRRATTLATEMLGIRFGKRILGDASDTNLGYMDDIRVWNRSLTQVSLSHF